MIWAGVTAIVVFVASFFCHKVFAGIGLVSSRKFRDDALNDIRNNTQAQQTGMQPAEAQMQPEAGTTVRFCSSCGAKLREEDVFCNKCGARQS